jgi:predicted nucleotidyltransferase
MNRLAQLGRLAAHHELVAVYLFGSRADDGLAALAGHAVTAAGSDLDVGVVTRSPAPGWEQLASLQNALEDVFAPLRVDLVPLRAVDPLFQFNAIDGHRVAAPDATAADLFELDVMRRAADCLPIQRAIERERFGVSTS